MKEQIKYPYGACECEIPTCIECRGMGPAAFEVTRDGKRIRVCTKCDLVNRGDTDRVLLVKGEDESKPFLQWDALGFLCIASMLAEKESPDARG